jgi:hypothetical protein
MAIRAMFATQSVWPRFKFYAALVAKHFDWLLTFEDIVNYIRLSVKSYLDYQGSKARQVGRSNKKAARRAAK